MLGGRGAGASIGTARGGSGRWLRAAFVRERERWRSAAMCACAFEWVTVREVAAEEMECEEAEVGMAVMGETGGSPALPLPLGLGVVGVAVCVEPLEEEVTEDSDRVGECDRELGSAGSDTDGMMPFAEEGGIACVRRLRRDESMYYKGIVSVFLMSIQRESHLC